MTPQELKNSILQLAIHGKLVEQRPEEGSAEELYREIQAEKQRLIKAGRLKKEKPLPEIMEEEKPFEIPESWMWVRVADCLSNRAGLAYKKGNLEIKSAHMIRVLRGGNISEMGYTFKSDDVMISDEFVNPELFLKENMLITPAVSSLEHIGKMGRIERDLPDTVVGGFVLMLSPHYNQKTFSCYLLFSLSSKYFRDCCRSIVNKSGQAFYNLSREKMMQLLIPLPPLVEQERIVAKIEELLPYIDRYEQAWSRLEAFNKRFPDDMRKSILQLAIQGKLVEQRPEEGTAEELYQEIQAEKQRPIKVGKIKKEKPLPEIAEEEKPFEIPESWKWVRFSVLMDSMSTGPFGSMLHKSDYVSNGIPLVNPANIVDGKIIPSEKMMVSADTAKRLNSYTLYSGALVMGRRGEMGRCAVVTDCENGWLCGTGSFFMMPNFHLFVYYLSLFFKTPYAKSYLTGESIGTTMSNLNHNILSRLPVPLPPLAEQKRIVARLKEVLPLCESLK